MIEVFHGSYTKVDKPDLSFSRKTLDFGVGFYVTPMREQAVSWAMRWLRRNRPAIVNRYVFHDEMLPELGVRVKDFPVYDREWLRLWRTIAPEFGRTSTTSSGAASQMTRSSTRWSFSSRN